MRRLIYTSFTQQRMLPDALFELLTRARAANQRAQISGVLFYHDGCFVQCLEGPSEAVSSLMNAIRRDRRHQSVTVLYDERSARRRLFRQWTMGFFHMDAIEGVAPPGLLSNQSSVETLLSGSAGEDPAAQLIGHFWRNNLAPVEVKRACRASRPALPAG